MYKASDIKKLWLSFLRRLLYLWIRPDVMLANHSATDDLDHNNVEVCYVFANRSIMDVLVLEQEAIKHNLTRPLSPLSQANITENSRFFNLSRQEGLLFKRNSPRGYSARELRLLNSQSDTELLFVPVSVYWGRAPEKERSMWRSLLADSWAVSSGLKKLVVAIFLRKQILVEISSPLALKSLQETQSDKKLLPRKLNRILRVHFRNRKHAALGPDLSHRRTMLSSLLTTPVVKAAIEQQAQMLAQEGAQQATDKAQKQAQKYANEIASNVSFNTVRFLYILLTWLWTKLYNGVNIQGLERLKETSEQQTLIYVPCHRSHIDYLILSYVLYNNGLMLPHIAAGVNLNFPIVGPLLRGGGAFFMRRSFKDNPLYTAIITEYLSQLLAKGNNAEYFIEGGRSRTGRALMPKSGMLAMTLSVLDRVDAKKLSFIPVYFGYEKVIESSTYLDELQGGEKKGESWLDLLRMRRIFKIKFGQLNVNFGTPINLLDWQQQHPNATAKQLSYHLARRINAAAALNPVNLLASILLATDNQALEQELLTAQLQLLQDLHNNCCYDPDTSIIEQSPEQIIDYGLDMNFISSGQQDIVKLAPREVILATYYRNNVLHLFAIPSLLALIMQREQALTETEIVQQVTTVYPYLRAELLLKYELDELAFIVKLYLSELVRANLLIQDEKNHYRCVSSNQHRLGLLAQLTMPIVERYFIAICLLQPNQDQDRAQLTQACEAMAQRLAILHGLNAPEFFDAKLFSLFINTMIEQDRLDQKLRVLFDLEALIKRTAPYLKPAIAYSIKRACLAPSAA